MKVVYNACYGGFSLSRDCIEYMANLGCLNAIKLLREVSNRGNLDSYDWRGLRHDPLLVIAIEKMGTDRASGDCSMLKIHKLKANKYRIQEYDGYEHVVEPKDLDWIII